jgi:twitching motility protein PilT
MAPHDDLLRHLSRNGVTELALASGRLPCVKIGGAFQPIANQAVSVHGLRELLGRLGGAHHVAALGPSPAQWSCDIDGLGTVAVAAVARGPESIQARFLLTRRDPNATLSPEFDVPTLTQHDAAPVVRNDGARVRHAFESIPGEDVPVAAPAPRAGAPIAAPVAAPAPRAPARAYASDARTLELDVRGVFGASSTSSPAPSSGAALGSILLRARELGASDVHVVAGRPPLFRIAGALTPEGAAIPPATAEALVVPRVPERLRDVLDREGSCDFALEEPGAGRFRVNVTRQRTGYKGAFRLVPQAIPTLASLGLPDSIALATRHHQGLIVLTGPTGHGKTNTLAALVDLINRETTHHVITVEDPIEFVHPKKRAMMSQREVGTHTKSFQAALKASLREDPDVIVVGELRDTETVRMALSASETGHLVIGTMNTPSAAKTIDRLVDLFPPADQQQVRMTLAGGLRLIVSQRLVANAKGDGLVAAAEVLPGSVALWNLIRENKTFQIPSLQQRGKALGIVRLDDSLAELVRTGRAPLEAARAAAEQPDELEAIVLGKRDAPTPHLAEGRPAAAAPAGPAAPGEGKGGLLNRAGAMFGKKP